MITIPEPPLPAGLSGFCSYAPPPPPLPVPFKPLVAFLKYVVPSHILPFPPIPEPPKPLLVLTELN